MAKKYEYRVIRFDMDWKGIGTKLITDFDAVERKMNALGSEGCELVKIPEIIAGQGCGR